MKVRVKTGLERGMVFDLKEVAGGWIALTGKAFKRDWPWRFRADELELYVPWWKRLWTRRQPLLLPVSIGRPRKYASNAEKQAAYRARKREE